MGDVTGRSAHSGVRSSLRVKRSILCMPQLVCSVCFSSLCLSLSLQPFSLQWLSFLAQLRGEKCTAARLYSSSKIEPIMSAEVTASELEECGPDCVRRGGALAPIPCTLEEHDYAGGFRTQNNSSLTMSLWLALEWESLMSPAFPLLFHRLNISKCCRWVKIFNVYCFTAQKWCYIIKVGVCPCVCVCFFLHWWVFKII